MCVHELASFWWKNITAMHVSETVKRFLNLQLGEDLTSFNKNNCVNFSGKKKEYNFCNSLWICFQNM